MINANELKTGNFIMKDGRVFQVGEILKSGIRVTYIRNDNSKMHTSLLSYEEIYHIPITDYWEEKMGFKNGFLSVHKYMGIQLKFPYCWVVSAYPNEDEVTVKLGMKGVAEVQNLYHALVGEELKITGLIIDGVANGTQLADWRNAHFV